MKEQPWWQTLWVKTPAIWGGLGGGMWAAALAAGRWSLGWYGGVLPGVNGFDFLTL